MKYSAIPTPYIAVKVNTNSDNNHIDLAIVHLTESYKNTLISRQADASHFKDDPSFYNMSFWDPNIQYYNWIDPTEDLEVILDKLETSDYCYIEIEEHFDLEQILVKSDLKLCAHTLQMGAGGIFNYVCYDENNGDEYFTDGIEL
jgi:hypothetical protein